MRTLHRTVLAAFLTLSLGAARAEPVTYTIMSKVSKVRFSLEHQGFIPVSGALKIAPGSFVFDKQDWSKSSVMVSMPVKMLDMGDGLWNEQIRDDRHWMGLFNTPTISFQSTRLERKDDTHGLLYGNLTVAGVTKPVVLQMQVNKMGRNGVSDLQAIGISAMTTIKRSQFGLDAYMDLVGDELAVDIQVEGWIGEDPDAAKEAMMNGDKGMDTGMGSMH
ncbi:MAG: YceI family protein [Burkholderiaceae bacterium]|nr:YceI family protein [Burkholderiaceae bacterium]